MVKKGKIIFLLLTMGLQIKTYCAPTKKSNSFKKVDMYKTFPLSAAGYLFPPNGKKVDIDEFGGYSIGIKLYKKNFFGMLTKIPHDKAENIIGYFLYFRSFFVELIKSLKFCKPIFTMLHKGRHNISRTSYFDIDCGYSLKKENINASFSQIEENIKGECTICLGSVSNNKDIIVGHKDGDNNKLIHPHHKKCLEQWVNTTGTCPYCRQPFSKEIADGKDDGGNFYAWIDIFRLSLQTVKGTYEYALTKNRDFHCSLRFSICPLIFSLETPTIFFRHFSLKKYKKDINFTFSWEDFFLHRFFSKPDFIILSLCIKGSIGFIFFIQKIGALFELTYIKDYCNKRYNFLAPVNVEGNAAVNREGNVALNVEENVAGNKKKDAAANKKKGHKIEFKITILINKDI